MPRPLVSRHNSRLNLEARRFDDARARACVCACGDTRAEPHSADLEAIDCIYALLRSILDDIIVCRRRDYFLHGLMGKGYGVFEMGL